MTDAVVAAIMGVSRSDLHCILAECDHPLGSTRGAQPKGFWRVDSDKPPELRHTVLTLVAFRDLEAKIEAAGGDRERGINEFLAQNYGEGWMLPETLRLSDYGLGHDDRAQVPQVVAGRLGPRFYDWQLAQTPEEAVRECHLHARNLLGADGYAHLLVRLIVGGAGVGADGIGLLTDPSIRPLLGGGGCVTALVEARAQGILDDHAYWAAADPLRDGDAPHADRYGQLLDRLHSRGLLDDTDYRNRIGRNPPTADTPQLQVAESGPAYRAVAPDDEKQGELFE